MHVPATDLRAQEGPGQYQVLRVAERAYVGRQVRQSHDVRNIAKVFKQPRGIRVLLELPVLCAGEAGTDEVLDISAFSDGGDDAVACTGQCAGAVHHLLQDGIDVKARADAQDRRTQL